MALILFLSRSALLPRSHIPALAAAVGSAVAAAAGAAIDDAAVPAAGAGVAGAEAAPVALAPGMVPAMASMWAFRALAPAPFGSLSLTKSAVVSNRFLRAATMPSSP